jgi:cystathionine gamma-synthase/methionine-gamma-lyase
LAIASSQFRKVWLLRTASVFPHPLGHLGDVHTLLLYPVIASHRDVAPKLRERQGIRDNLVRISAGIEAFEDIQTDIDAALLG